MKKNKLPNLVVILILTLVTGVVWISLSIYRSITTKPAPVVPESVSNPLSPSLDTQTLNQVGSRLFLDNSQIPEISVTQSSPQPIIQTTPIPQATPAQTSTISATPTIAPTATP